jgi:hypothetical protein
MRLDPIGVACALHQIGEGAHAEGVHVSGGASIRSCVLSASSAEAWECRTSREVVDMRRTHLPPRLAAERSFARTRGLLP